MSSLFLIDRIKEDCKRHGHGRKKWWVKQLGITPQTLSYWLIGHRRPRADHLQNIENILSTLGSKENAEIMFESLLRQYFDKTNFDKNITAMVIKQIAGVESLDPRKLAFLSYLVEVLNIENFNDNNPLLNNRLGWLLEVSGKKPKFKPTGDQSAQFVDIGLPFSDPNVFRYLSDAQTKLGKRWHLYDCEITTMKKSYYVGFPSADN